MKVNYNKLWKMLIDKKMNKNALRHAVSMSPNTMAKMGRDENVSLDVLVRICEVLKCDIGDIMEVIPDAAEEKERKDMVEKYIIRDISMKYSGKHIRRR